MPAQIDIPSGVGSKSDWGLWGAPDVVSAVATDDGEASYIYGISGGRVCAQFYTFPTIAGVNDPVAAASLYFTAAKNVNGVGGQSFFGVWNELPMSTNKWSSLGQPGVFVALSDNATDLSLAAVNGHHGIYLTAAGGPQNPAIVWVTYLYRVVTFSYIAGSSGDFSYGAGSLLAALLESGIAAAIGANLLLRDMPRVRRALSRVWRGGRSVRLLDHELEPAWRAWRAFRSPAYGGC